MSRLISKRCTDGETNETKSGKIDRCAWSAAAAVAPGACRWPRKTTTRMAGMTTDIPGAQPGIHLVSPVPNGQWTQPAGDYANTRYSPLAQINTGNVQNLHVVATASDRHSPRP